MLLEFRIDEIAEFQNTVLLNADDVLIVVIGRSIPRSVYYGTTECTIRGIFN